MLINSSGNVGIGTTAPAKPLHVRTTADGTIVRVDRGNVSSWDFSIGNTPHISGGSSGDLEIIPQNGNMGFAVARAGQTGVNMRIRDGTLTLGSGIKFNSDTAAANELDDYEEGTWTPDITSGSEGITLDYVEGKYFKIGKWVWIHCGFHISAIASIQTYGCKIDGLPYASANYGSYQEPQAFVTGAVFDTAALSQGGLTFFKENSNARLQARDNTGNVDAGIANNDVFKVGTYMKLQMAYYTA